MTKHSPGPWWRGGGGRGAPDGIYDAHGDGIVSARPWQTEDQERWNANAALIAAAPEMLALLRDLSRLPHSGRCPVCGSTEFDEHGSPQPCRPDCRLAALLKRLGE